MKKFVKMSLVAAVAVAGLTTTSSAVSLADAVKDTSVAGYVRYRINTTADETAGTPSDQSTEGKLVYNFKTKVNDAVTANVKFVGYYKDDNTGDASQADLNTNQANFIIATPVATVIAGLQTTQSPFAANNGDTRSNGLTALIPAGPVTIAAAHYIDTLAGQANILGLSQTDAAINAIGVIGSVAGVNAELWRATLGNYDSHDWTALLVSTKIGPVSVSAHHAEHDAGDSTKNENTQLVVSGKVGAVSLVAGVASTGKDSGDVTLDGDTDSKLILALEGAATTKAADADAVLLSATMPVGPVSVNIAYLDGDTAGTDFDETKVTVSYAMSKNFKLSAWMSDSKLGTADLEETRVEAIYTF